MKDRHGSSRSDWGFWAPLCPMICIIILGKLILRCSLIARSKHSFDGMDSITCLEIETHRSWMRGIWHDGIDGDRPLALLGRDLSYVGLIYDFRAVIPSPAQHRIPNSSLSFPSNDSTTTTLRIQQDVHARFWSEPFLFLSIILGRCILINLT